MQQKQKIQTQLSIETREIVRDFSQHLEEDGKRPKTIEIYVGDVVGFLVYLKQRVNDFTGDLKRYQITSYRNNLVEKGYEASTVNKKINSLQAFNYWLVGKGLTKETVIDLRKDRVKVASGSEKQVEVFNEKQLEKLLFYVQGEKVSVRNKTIVLPLLYTGMRVSKLCDIKAKNIDFLTGHLKVVGEVLGSKKASEVVFGGLLFLPIGDWYFSQFVESICPKE